jgi:hypothetical protein
MITLPIPTHAVTINQFDKDTIAVSSQVISLFSAAIMKDAIDKPIVGRTYNIVKITNIAIRTDSSVTEFAIVVDNNF